MAIKLNIRALCLQLGYCEGMKASSLFVRWCGKKPFEDARTAVLDFVQQCKTQCTAPKRALKTCCLETLTKNSKAKACEACGGKTRLLKGSDYPMRDYLLQLSEMDVDSFGDKAYPKTEYPGSDDGSCRIGQWVFFCGMPYDCDVVDVDCLDSVFADYGAMDATYRVVHVGKLATRASSRGKIPCGKE